MASIQTKRGFELDKLSSTAQPATLKRGAIGEFQRGLAAYMERRKMNRLRYSRIPRIAK